MESLRVWLPTKKPYKSLQVSVKTTKNPYYHEDRSSLISGPYVDLWDVTRPVGEC